MYENFPNTEKPNLLEKKNMRYRHLKQKIDLNKCVENENLGNTPCLLYLHIHQTCPSFIYFHKLKKEKKKKRFQFVNVRLNSLCPLVSLLV